ncbi:MAG: hypothetical protein LBG58_11725 [Planctomycetaceae bacterium]|nr:hypothetical protein [Planctomycetaceae bacterium]
MVSTTKRNDNGIVLVGSGMFVTIYLEPKDVSFSKSVLGEDYVKATYDGFLFEHPKNVWKAGGGDVVNGSKIDGEDHVYWVQFPLGTSARVLTLNIPFGYYDGTAIVPIVTNPHVGTFDGQGGCVITKFGKKATRVPNNVPNLLNAVKNNTSYTDGWKYTD